MVNPNSDAQSAVAAKEVAPRSRGQWILGILLIALAGVLLVVRYARGPHSNRRAGAASPIRVSADLRPVDAFPAAPGEFKGSNVLIITLDTTRADRFGCMGYSKKLTPNLDALARRGALFSQAITPSPVTLPAHSSIMTGLAPVRHGARCNGLFSLGPDQHTLAEAFAARGYATGAVISAVVLDSRFGLDQGFATYDDDLSAEESPAWFRSPERTADQATERAISWLEGRKGDQPFFFWVHYFDPHAPYAPPEPYKSQTVSAYDGEIAFMDAQIGVLLAKLEALGLRDRTLVVVTADHGESLGQHDEGTHGCLIYDATMRVPLILAHGSRLGGVHLTRQTCLMDIAPTLASLVGLAPFEKSDGLDLTQTASGERTMALETLEGWFECGLAPLLGVQTGSKKYVFGPNPELYDLASDPNEETNLVTKRPDEALALRQRLSEYYGQDLDKAGFARPTRQMSAEEAEKLAAIGYSMANPTGEAPPPESPPPDPRTMMALKRRLEITSFMTSREDLDRAIAEMEEMARQNPDVYMVNWHLAARLAERGDVEKAEAALERCRLLHPTLPLPVFALAKLKAQQGNVEEALAFYRRGLELSPDHFSGLFESGKLLLSNRQPAEAAPLLARAFQIRPADPLVTQTMVVAMTTAGKAEEAIGLLTDAINDKPNLLEARNSLARLLMAQGRWSEGLAMLRDAVARAPQRLELANNLALALIACPEEERERVEAALIMERVCRETRYQHPEFIFSLCRVYGSLHRWDEAIELAQKAQGLAKARGSDELAQVIGKELEEFKAGKEKYSPLIRPRSLPGSEDTPTSQSHVEPGQDND